jgi:hypothetical protein
VEKGTLIRKVNQPEAGSDGESGRGLINFSAANFKTSETTDRVM